MLTAGSGTLPVVVYCCYTPKIMSLFNWLNKRGCGVLLHPTMLPSEQGIGTFGKSAYRFVDTLTEMRVTYWQVCPLGPTGFGDSPYQCFSSFAGNPYLIDFEKLVELNLLENADLKRLRELPRERVDYGMLWDAFYATARKLYANIRKNRALLKKIGDFETFRRDNAYWLSGFSLYTALKTHFKGVAWYRWPEKARKFASAIKANWGTDVAAEVEMTEIIQFIFFSQWRELRAYARRRNLKIIGDTPIFTALDSADVWQTPEIFQINPKTAEPLAVAGVPPDYFSATGQLWGNPLYDWAALKKTNYAWWIARLRACFELYDVVRIDHFRAFYDYWRIPAGSPDARTGEWVLGPGLEFFETVRKSLGNACLIAEDLGDMNDGVRKLLADTGLPGMAVLQFAFGGDPNNLYLPHNIGANTIAYPGTHDNNTVVGWYGSCGEYERDFFRRYLWSDGSSPHWTLINAAMKSHARLAVISVQDLLGLGAGARFNEPGTNGKNWQWRLSEAEFKRFCGDLVGQFRELVEISARN